MTEQPTTPPRTPKPPAVVWSDVVRRIENREPIPPLPGETALHPQAPRALPLRSGPLTAVPSMDVDEDGLPASLPAQPYGAGGRTPPTPAELREIADDLNRHGGLDEVFVAELLRQASDPLAAAKRGLGIADTPPPVTTTKPITYETIVEALETDREFVAHVNDGVDRAAVLDAVQTAAQHPPEHQHIWSGNPMRCVECRRHLRPWWRRALDRVRRWVR